MTSEVQLRDDTGSLFVGSVNDPAATGAGDSLIAMLNALMVKGKTKRVSITGITCSAAAYTAGDNVGGLLTFNSVLRTGVESGLIQFASADIIDSRFTGLTLWLFSANPTSSTITDKTAFVLHKNDVAKRIGVISLVNAATGGAGGGNGIQSVYNSGPLAMPVSGTTSGVIYAALVTDAAITPTTTSDFQKVTLSALPD
jgi:hypothetical protein